MKGERKRPHMLATLAVRELCRKYRDGAKITALMAEYDISKKYVYDLLGRCGVPLRPARRKTKPKGRGPSANSLCWSCQKAVPSPADPAPCPWAFSFRPVEGWKAVRAGEMGKRQKGVDPGSYFCGGMPAFFGGPAEKGKVSEMPVFTGTANTVCPFYVRESEFRITCEGFPIPAPSPSALPLRAPSAGGSNATARRSVTRECPIAAVLLKRN